MEVDKVLGQMDGWKLVKPYFLDETSVQIEGNKKIYVWRKVDDKDRPHLVPKKARSGVTKIMMRGYITSKRRAIFLPVNVSITSEKYCQVLQDGLLPVINCYYADGKFIFGQNNASCHNSSESRNWLDDRQIKVNQWPPQSPDINIIDNIWKWMKLEQQKHIEKITSRQDIVNASQYIWRKFEVILNRRRVAQTIFTIISPINWHVQND